MIFAIEIGIAGDGKKYITFWQIIKNIYMNFNKKFYF